VDQIHATDARRREQTGNQPRAARGNERRDEYRAVDERLARRERREQLDPKYRREPSREEHARGGADNRKKDALDEHLHGECKAPRSERGANRELASSSRRSQQQQRTDVGRSDEQDD